MTVIYLALSCLIIASVFIRRGNAIERGLNKSPWKTYFKASHLWDEDPEAKCITGAVFSEYVSNGHHSLLSGARS